MVPATPSKTADSGDGQPAFDMVALPESGRIFSGERRVRLGDVDPSGRLRLDALTRYTQDVSNDDTTDVGLTDDLAFVVRRTTVDVHQPGVFGEDLVIQTFCGRLGKRWAERRLVVSGSAGASYDVATLWVHIDTDSGRPLALSHDFLRHYAEAAGERTVSARHELRRPDAVESPGFDPSSIERSPWPLRAVDFDTFGHMNNAAYWAVIEEHLSVHSVSRPLRCAIEYGAGIGPDDAVTIAWGPDSSDRHRLWWEVDGQPAASALLEPLPEVANTVPR